MGIIRSRRATARRMVLLAAATSLAVLPGTMAVAHAGAGAAAVQKPLAKVVIKVKPSVVPPGQAVTVTGKGLVPLQKVTFILAGEQIGGTQTDGKAPATIPSDIKPGQYTLGVYYPEGKLAGGAYVTVSASWPQFGDTPGHTSYNMYENQLSTDTVGGLSLKWTANPGKGWEGYSAAVVNRTMYAGSAAFDATTGTPKWSYDTGEYVYSSPAVVNGIDYIASSTSSGDEGTVYALDAATGTVRWTHTAKGTFFSSPVVANGTLYISSYDGTVYALDAGTGALRWSYTIDGNTIPASPAVANGTVYVGVAVGVVDALDAATGTFRWAHGLDGGLAYWNSPAVANGTVYIGDENGTLYALRATTGAMKWTYTAGSRVDDTAAVTNSLVYFGTDDGEVYALSTASGLIAWSFKAGASVSGTPAVANDVVYVGSKGGPLYALNAISGEPLWSYEIGDDIYAQSAVVSDGMVYVAGYDHHDTGLEYAFGL